MYAMPQGREPVVPLGLGGDPAAASHREVGNTCGASSPRINSARRRRRQVSPGPALASSAPSFSSIRGSVSASGRARIAVAIEALTAEICHPPIPSWTVGPVAMRNISAALHGTSGARSGKLSAGERSSLNQALAKALAFRDAGKMPEAREWAAELIRLLKSHDLLM
jgi:hypothetical protein